MALAASEQFGTIIGEIKKGDIDLHTDLYNTWRDSLHKAVGTVFTEGDADFNLLQKFKLNTSKFAAAKAFQATQLVARKASDAEYDKKARQILGTFNGYQKAEYNTTVTRARTAKQWAEFDQPNRRRLFPNLRWIPSRSASKREIHIPFYNKVWPKDDPFWSMNTPGSLWNCKCDWQETDAPVTGNEATDITPAIGLKGNPGQTGQIFSNDATYFTPKAIKAIADVQYTDNVSNLLINVNADAVEIADNVRTGRILLANFNNMKLSVRGNFTRRKNPEYLLNSSLADAKRVETWNVASSFNSALKQECEVVIIDLFKMQSKSFMTGEVAKGIRNRYADFISGRIKECYVVWKDKSVLITSDMFKGVTNANKREVGVIIKQLLDKIV